jgi:sulfite reductase beta subunit-like hemoprotein
MESHLQFMHEYQDDRDRTKFSSLEVEKFRRVVEYMRTTEFEPAKRELARRDFHRWFSEHDKRRDCNLVEAFPELETFFNNCA